MPAVRRVFLLGLALGLAGCGGPDPSLQRHDKLLAAFNDAADLLGSVTDQDKVKEVQPKLMAVGERIRELYREARIAKDTAMDLENLKFHEKYGQQLKEMKAAQDRYFKEIERVSTVPGGDRLVKTMANYTSTSTPR
jgi:hypothetical protein